MAIQRCCPEPSIVGRELEQEAAVFKALGDPARLAILATLAGNGHEVCVCDFVDGLNLNQSTISHHLKILKEAGLVTSVRRGTWGHYSLAPGARAKSEAALTAVFAVAVPA